MSIKIFNPLGKMVWTIAKEFGEGEFLEKINLENEPSGVYLIQVRSSNLNLTRKIMLRNEL